MRRNARVGLFLVIATLLAVAGSTAFAKPQNQIKYYFLNSGVQPKAAGKIIMVSNPAQTFFTIVVSHMTPGPYDVVLNGAVVDVLSVGANGEGKLTHRSSKNGKPGGTALSYDPRGGDLAIMATGVELLGAVIPLTPAEAQAKVEVEIDLANMGVGAGSAQAELTARFGRMQFEVQLDDAAPGTYDLLVGGVKVGEVVVGAGGTGHVDFDSRPSSDDDDDGLALLLTFDPRGQQIQLMQGGAAMFAAMFPLQ
ncbi:MAG TPA: hypothetical protein VFG76_11475 [Candidatus Polarisedimenticolia bacterium]|nr:hypothetical protein [Candidatus Polarisedimenticolia bacterium]